MQAEGRGKCSGLRSWQVIEPLVTEHTWRTDSGRSDMAHELYVEDGELNLGSRPLRGRQAIYEWGRQLVENPPWNASTPTCSTEATPSTSRRPRGCQSDQLAGHRDLGVIQLTGTLSAG